MLHWIEMQLFSVSYRTPAVISERRLYAWHLELTCMLLAYPASLRKLLWWLPIPIFKFRIKFLNIEVCKVAWLCKVYGCLVFFHLNSYVYVVCHLIQKQNQDTQTKMATNRLENNTRDVETHDGREVNYCWVILTLRSSLFTPVSLIPFTEQEKLVYSCCPKLGGYTSSS